MFKTIPPQRLKEILADAAASPMSDSSVAYPDWYLQRWHYLPEGYLSRRSVRLYPVYVPRLYNHLRERTLLRRMIQAIANQSPANVLDIGCGPGRLLERLVRQGAGYQLSGLDLSPFFLELAADRLQGVDATAELVHGDAAGLPWDVGTFDAVCAVHVFGHMPEAAAEQALSEAVRVTAPGGRLLVIGHSWHPWRLPKWTRLLSDQPFNLGLIRIRTLERV